MAALAASSDETESWDDDPDLDFSSGPLLHPSHLDPALTLQPPSDSEPASPAVDNDFDDVEGFFERVAGDWDDAPRTREEENESSVDSSRTNTTTGTLKGLMEGLSLDQEADTTLSLGAVVPSSSPPRAPTELDATPRTSKTTTLRGSSPLSVLLASSRSPSARHKVHHLGSTPLGQAQAVDDWDQDLEGLDSLQLGGSASDAGLRSVVKKGSFASHISLEDDEDDMSAFDEPQQEQVARKRISIASFTDAEDNGDGEDDFELPSTLSHVSLAPTLVNRPSNVSLNSVADSPVTVPPHTPTTPGLAVPAPQNPAYTTASSAPSSPGPLTPSRSSDDEGPSSSALDDDDDADFFEDLVLPSYFLAGAVDDAERKRAATPPTSEGEPDSDAPGAAKVDLQSILRAKLEARGGRGLLFHPNAAVRARACRRSRRRSRSDSLDTASTTRTATGPTSRASCAARPSRLRRLPTPAPPLKPRTRSGARTRCASACAPSAVCAPRRRSRRGRRGRPVARRAGSAYCGARRAMGKCRQPWGDGLFRLCRRGHLLVRRRQRARRSRMRRVQTSSRAFRSPCDRPQRMARSVPRQSRRLTRPRGARLGDGGHRLLPLQRVAGVLACGRRACAAPRPSPTCAPPAKVGRTSSTRQLQRLRHRTAACRPSR